MMNEEDKWVIKVANLHKCQQKLRRKFSDQIDRSPSRMMGRFVLSPFSFLAKAGGWIADCQWLPSLVSFRKLWENDPDVLDIKTQKKELESMLKLSGGKPIFAAPYQTAALGDRRSAMIWHDRGKHNGDTSYEEDEWDIIKAGNLGLWCC